jgi:hypothetical protein
VFVQELKVDFMGEQIDDFCDGYVNTWDEAVMDYTRFNMALGFNKSLRTNSITYQDFSQGGFYIQGYDFTTNAESGISQFSVPSVRTGNLRV